MYVTNFSLGLFKILSTLSIPQLGYYAKVGLSGDIDLVIERFK